MTVLWISLTVVWIVCLLMVQASLSVSTVALWGLLLLYTRFSVGIPLVCLAIMWGAALFLTLLFNVKPLRRRLISQGLLALAKGSLPRISATEQEALDAGTVAWEGSLFRGAPDWSALETIPLAQLTAEEQAFLDGPVVTLCDMINDWEITHTYVDLPPEIWTFIKAQGFFGLIIPKQYGGKNFSAYAHSEIVTRIAARSATVSTTVSVPNSLGPAELILHYGTQAQKDQYLPKLATGEHVPCFALTGPTAGSDAGAIPDIGVICEGEFNGEKIIGMKLTWNKRYITLAPVATVLGLAFKLSDPDHLLGEQTALGITCALIPTDHPGVEIGRRHFPLNCAFQNGPTRGESVFVPLDWIIGGKAMIGQGWRMLMECLSVGRAISLPSASAGGLKAACFSSGAYARIRRQFKQSIGQFEGIQEALSDVVCHNYVVEAMRELTTAIIDQGEKPAVLSAIIKYHATERGRSAMTHAMDIHGGKGICLGPTNYLGRGYQTTPIMITVEGANILTRSMIIFGQGATRCHPFIYEEINALGMTDPKQRLVAFDKAIIGHLGFTLATVCRSLVLSLTGGLLSRVPGFKTCRARRFARRFNRYSANFSLLANAALIALGGQLKRKEALSARLGDVFSSLYMGAAVLKRFQSQGELKEDLPIVSRICQQLCFDMQQQLSEVLANFPNRPLAWLLKALIFPLGKHACLPDDRLLGPVSSLVMTPTATRDRLITGVLVGAKKNKLYEQLEDCLQQVIAVEDIEKAVHLAHKRGELIQSTLAEQMLEASVNELITEAQLVKWQAANAARAAVIAVDDFAADALGAK